MFAFCNKSHGLYQEEFKRYLLAKKTSKNQYLERGKCQYNSDIYRLWLFASDKASDQCFVIVPSLFNSPDILFFNKKESHVEYLKQFGNVYLLEWQEVEKDVYLSDYAEAVACSLRFIRSNLKQKVNLVGHCIGGNIAIFSTVIYNQIESLTLLTTPWDYSHFAKQAFFAEYLQIKKPVMGLKCVPKIYIQMLFFMVFSQQYGAKLNKYFTLKSQEEREKYLRVEQWLQSGIGISSALYNEVIDSFVFRNSLVKENFYINKNLVLLNQIQVPSCIVSAKLDQIAPISSIVPLQKGLKYSKLITVEGGHISYLVNNDQLFKQKYAKWFVNK